VHYFSLHSLSHQGNFPSLNLFLFFLFSLLHSKREVEIGLKKTEYRIYWKKGKKIEEMKKAKGILIGGNVKFSSGSILRNLS